MSENIRGKINEHNKKVEFEFRRAYRGEFICISEILAAKEKIIINHYDRLG
jgi:hypothetical protein